MELKHSKILRINCFGIEYFIRTLQIVVEELLAEIHQTTVIMIHSLVIEIIKILQIDYFVEIQQIVVVVAKSFPFVPLVAAIVELPFHQNLVLPLVRIIGFILN